MFQPWIEERGNNVGSEAGIEKQCLRVDEWGNPAEPLQNQKKGRQQEREYELYNIYASIH